MKDYIQKYIEAYYNPTNINLEVLQGIIIEVFEAVLQDFIDKLYESWRKRYLAVIKAQGGRRNTRTWDSWCCTIIPVVILTVIFIQATLVKTLVQ